VTVASEATSCTGVPAPTPRCNGGSAGADRVYGGDGNDACVTTIDASGNDAVFGGPGIDHYWSDPGDDVTSAEIFGPCFAE
jgi:Ca2+-binding RTX toxin-like protein